MNANDVCPVHKGSLYLTHNQHKSYYETVAEAIKSSFSPPRILTY
jgi:hypothetical protein